MKRSQNGQVKKVFFTIFFLLLSGFIQESFDELELHKGDPDYKFASLVLDGMSLKELVEFDKNMGHSFGNINYGNSFTMGNSELKASDEAFVCMLVGYTGLWKLPIAYFLIKGMKSGIQAGIIRECLTQSFDIGVHIMNVTCDGAIHNIAALNILGSKIFANDPINTVTSFPHPSEDANYKVGVWLDPPHMMKNLRNALGDLKVLIWPGRGNVRYVHYHYILGIDTRGGSSRSSARPRLGSYYIRAAARFRLGSSYYKRAAARFRLGSLYYIRAAARTARRKNDNFKMIIFNRFFLFLLYILNFR